MATRIPAAVLRRNLGAIAASQAGYFTADQALGAGYEDANDADRLRHDPALQIVADQKLGEPLGSQPTLSRWEDHVCDIKTLQNWMGHKDLASTMVYLKAVRNKDVMARVNSSELAALAI